MLLIAFFFFNYFCSKQLGRLIRPRVGVVEKNRRRARVALPALRLRSLISAEIIIVLKWKDVVSPIAKHSPRYRLHFSRVFYT